VGLVQKTPSFKLTCRNCPPPASEGHMAMRQERQSPSQSRPLDVSFHCEGGSCSFMSAVRHIVKPKPNLGSPAKRWAPLSRLRANAVEM